MINVFQIVSCLKETANRICERGSYETFHRRNAHIINMGEENVTNYEKKNFTIVM